MKIRTKLALLLTCVFALASCDKEDDIKEIKEISGVSFSINSLELAIGDTATITATILPYSLSSADIEWADDIKESVRWKSNNPAVATVTQDGLVKAVGKGSCTILFTCGPYADECDIIVRDFDVKALYGQWMSEDSIGYYFQFDGTGKVQNDPLSWTFDGMRLTVQSASESNTFVVVSTEPGKFAYYDITDADKKRYSMQMIARQITADDLKHGVKQVEGKDGLKYEAVDMGLPDGVLWATSNLMAQSPAQAGDFYAWGETETKERYILEKYKWYNDTILELTKYINNENAEPVTLESQDDAASVIMGGKWRMPTQQEIKMLCDKCMIIWSRLDDVDGLLFISMEKGYEGNSLFFPLPGMELNYTGHITQGRMTMAVYWSSTLSGSDDFSAYCLQMSNMPSIEVFAAYYPSSTTKRWSGAYIRPVTK